MAVVGCGQLGGQFFADVTGVYGKGDTGVNGAGVATGVSGTGGTGVSGTGGSLGVSGFGPIGVKGEAAAGSNGVFGLADNAAGSGVYGQNDGTGYGVAGRAMGGTGVFGDSTTGTGLLGHGGENGVLAEGGTFGVFATGNDYGVYASAPNYGIFGDSQDGVGVQASSENGTALNVQGKIVSKRSGIVTLQASAGLPYVSVTLTKMTPATFIVATVQGNAGGVWVRSVGISPPTDTFKIYLNKVPSADVRIGWFAMR